MLKNSKLFTFFAFSLLLFVVGVWTNQTVTEAQTAQQSASGHGTLIVQDEQGKNVRRQFSFNAKTNADGTVSGHAVLHNNASFTGANGKGKECE